MRAGTLREPAGLGEFLLRFVIPAQALQDFRQRAVDLGRVGAEPRGGAELFDCVDQVATIGESDGEVIVSLECIWVGP